MKNFIQKLSLVTISLSVLGCSTVHNFSPEYDKDSETLKFGTLVLENMKLDESKVSYAGSTNHVTISETKFSSDANDCKNISITELNVPTDYYFYNNMHEDVLKKHKGMCSIENIDNIYFMRCLSSLFSSSEDNLNPKTYSYYIASALQSSEVNKKTLVSIASSSCIRNFKRHYYAHNTSGNVQLYNLEKDEWASSDDSHVTGVRLDKAGIFKYTKTGEVKSDSVATGILNKGRNFQLIEETNKIPQRIGTTYAIRFELEGHPKGSVIPVTVIVNHPATKNSQTGELTTVSTWTSNFKIGHPYHVLKEHTTPGDMPHGIYTIQLVHKGKVIFENKFEVVESGT